MLEVLAASQLRHGSIAALAAGSLGVPIHPLAEFLLAGGDAGSRAPPPVAAVFVTTPGAVGQAVLLQPVEAALLYGVQQAVERAAGDSLLHDHQPPGAGPSKCVSTDLLAPTCLRPVEGLAREAERLRLPVDGLLEARQLLLDILPAGWGASCALDWGGKTPPRTPPREACGLMGTAGPSPLPALPGLPLPSVILDRFQAKEEWKMKSPSSPEDSLPGLPGPPRAPAPPAGGLG